MNLETLQLPDVTFTVDEVKASEFATALGTWLERDADGSTLVPIGMLFFVLYRDSAKVFEHLGVPWERALFGGIRFEYLRQVRTGESLLARSRFLASRERETPQERLGIVELETTYHDTSGQAIVREVSTLIVRGGLKAS